LVGSKAFCSKTAAQDPGKWLRVLGKSGRGKSIHVWSSPLNSFQRFRNSVQVFDAITLTLLPYSYPYQNNHH
jgi:hypothetical protein